MDEHWSCPQDTVHKNIHVPEQFFQELTQVFFLVTDSVQK